MAATDENIHARTSHCDIGCVTQRTEQNYCIRRDNISFITKNAAIMTGTLIFHALLS